MGKLTRTANFGYPASLTGAMKSQLTVRGFTVLSKATSVFRDLPH
jgi:hypothetical protein